MVTEWANYSDERLIESYRQSILATDPEFRALAEPLRRELMLRLMRGEAAYTAVRKATASTRGWGPSPVFMLLGAVLGLLGLWLLGGLR